MIALIAALLLNGTAADLPQIFQSACLDGQVKLSAGTPIGLDAVPDVLRRRLGNPASAQVWRLGGEGDTYLYILTYQPGTNPNARVCGLASEQMDARAAADTLELRVTGQASHDYQPSMQWLSPQAGYRAVVTRAGKFKVAQVNWLNDAERQAAMKAYAQLAH